jgi:flagellar hook-basal body complex protein FliE
MVINDVNNVLAQIRSYQSKMSEPKVIQSNELRPGALWETGQTESAGAGNFQKMVSNAFIDSMRQVNQLQADSNNLLTRFEMGEDVELTDLVMSMQKSSLAFEATLQVRNKILKAYEDIMNMPV